MKRIKPTNRKETGSVYFLTLASALVLVALVLGLSVHNLQFRRSSRSQTQIDRAYIYAEFGIRHAMHFTKVEPDWRQILSNGTWLEDIAVDQATYTVTGIDPVDGDLANNPDDPVVLTATATINDVSRTISVKTKPAPFRILNYAVAAANNIDISNKVRINGDVTSNADIDKSGGNTWIFGNAEAVGTIHETINISGDIVPGSSPKDFPNAEEIMAYYTSRATFIPYIATIENILLSPSNNPFGPTNPDGLYYIDCDIGEITIKNCRIIGTLIIRSILIDKVTIESAVNWQPARPDYPALIVDHQLSRIKIHTENDLSEDSINTDLSLPGEPGYGDEVDIYPNIIKGLICCYNDISLESKCNIQGTVIARNDIILKDDAVCTYDPAILDNPPEGFHNSALIPVHGTWRRLIP
ncbi:MAG: hypothetical protein KAJ46_01700 [Sedimentisphaerales bacterium]|nr:hypothetical protein [Sedimentisphaerales bacterium]